MLFPKAEEMIAHGITNVASTILSNWRKPNLVSQTLHETLDDTKRIRAEVS